MKKIITALIVLAALYGGFYYWGNFHALVPGVAYRSAQLEPSRLAMVIKDYNIKSVLNLRGKSDSSNWYMDEVRVTEELGVRHESWKISALRHVSPKELSEILAVLDQLPKPVLIHCQGGADRTGLISAAWMFSRQHQSAEQAKQQLSFIYGHLPWFGNPTIAMDLSFAKFVAKRQAVSATSLLESTKPVAVN